VIQRLRSLLAAAIGLLAGGIASAAEPAVEAPTSPAKVVVIPLRGPITKPELYILRRGIKDAIEQRVDTLVLDLETPGGQLDVTFEMLKALEKFTGKTVTYVNREAMSAGALISAGTDEIYFAPGAVIGAAAPVLSDGGDIGKTMEGKLVSYLTARMRSISEGKGYRGAVISAMIDMDSEFKIGDTIIKEKGKLLSLTASEAMQAYGDPALPLLGSGVAENLEALLNQLHPQGTYTVKTLEVSWSERLAQYMVAITPMLLGLGILALFIEFKTPGFGIFGITGLSLLAIVFAGQFVAGLSGHEPALVFLLGLALLAIELFVFPGVLLLAMSGVVLMLGSLVWAMTDLWPNEAIPLSGDVFVRPLASVIGGMVLAVVLFAALLKFLPQGGLWGNLVLDAVVDTPSTEPRPLVGGERPEFRGSALVGQAGVAATPLFPSGQVEISGQRYEARLAMGYANAGTPVKVTGVAEFGLTVEVLS
jgi:membrane-bound serine protease (ClpP class)